MKKRAGGRASCYVLWDSIHQGCLYESLNAIWSHNVTDDDLLGNEGLSPHLEVLAMYQIDLWVQIHSDLPLLSVEVRRVISPMIHYFQFHVPNAYSHGFLLSFLLFKHWLMK